VLPLRVFCEYVTQETKAKIALLLIEPGSTEFGEGLTPSVEGVAEKISETLLRLLATKAGS
jgi:Ni,Fe-hydrogenase maturation factor